MANLKKGQRELRVVVEEQSPLETTLKEWAKDRGLTDAKAVRCILADWTDAMRGKPNPFAIAIAAASAGVNLATSPSQANTPATELSPEEKRRQQALLDSVDQFM